MIFIDRTDGRKLRNLSSFTALMPYLMRGRNESAVYFSKDIDVENALRYVHRKNAELDSTSDEEDGRYSLFGVVLATAARTLALKPRLNWFIHRRGLYERNHICLSFIVKKRLTEEAGESNAKIYFKPEDTVSESMERINAAIEEARGDKPNDGDREAELCHSIPFGKAIITSGFRLLDHFNLAPGWMIRNDPLFTSIFFANLGSIGLDTPFHHLYEWGSASLFVVMGKMFQKEVIRHDGSTSRRHFINFKVSVDERIADGLYFAHAASLFHRLIGHPELLEERPDLSAASIRNH